jgi:hypothetical protein
MSHTSNIIASCIAVALALYALGVTHWTAYAAAGAMVSILYQHRRNP